MCSRSSGQRCIQRQLRFTHNDTYSTRSGCSRSSICLFLPVVYSVVLASPIRTMDNPTFKKDESILNNRKDNTYLDIADIDTEILVTERQTVLL